MREQMRLQQPGILGLNMEDQPAIPDVVVVAQNGRTLRHRIPKVSRERLTRPRACNSIKGLVLTQVAASILKPCYSPFLFGGPLRRVPKIPWPVLVWSRSSSSWYVVG